MDQYFLGIDIGTTSVKVCIINTKDHSVEAHHGKDTHSNVPSDTGPGGNKQDVSTIISAVNLCVSKLPKQLLQKVSRVGICGQMHGVMFWKNDPDEKAWEIVGKEKSVRFDVIKDKVSALYTWQDNRCNPEFLASLPKPKSHLKISTGFGCATIFWFTKNKCEKLKKFNCAGTITDFAVSILCNLDKPVISNQNAASWGYLNAKLNCWNTEILEEAGFPVRLLPDIRDSSKIAGRLVDSWHGIPKGTPIGVGFGDIQCSVLSTIETHSDAVLNISTSAQITFIADNYQPPDTPTESSIEYFPYFNNQFIAIAASLNGGNSLATFVKMLQQWTLELGFSVPQAKVWEKILALSEDDNSISDLKIVPTCLGERHAPDVSASVQNIHVGNLGLGQVFRALCKGLLENLHSMMPKEILQDAKISRIVGNGSGLSRNNVLQKEVQNLYQLPLVFTKGGDAAKGAAMAVAFINDQPCDRNVKDVELICTRLRRVDQLCRLPNSVLQQLALCGYYEDLENGVTLFRQGDSGKCWYAVMSGSLEVRVAQPETDTKNAVTLCTLGVGATFGESILQDLPRDTTVVTQTTCELLRVEQQDFKLIWEKNKELMNDLVSNCKLKNGFGSGVSGKGMNQSASPPPRRSLSPDQPNPAEPITDQPSQVIGRIGWALRTLLLSQNTCLKDRKVSGRLVRRCAPGTELVDWLMELSPSIHSRAQAAAMWQALLEEGVISHVSKEQSFKDKCFLYRFWQDEEGATALPSSEDVATAEDQLLDNLGTLINRGPDAYLRMIMRKQSHERTADDLEIIYEELLHIRALSHLSNSVKREIASAIVFEAHSKAGTVLFHQGDEGRSWYIIVRGSVDVVIHGKGTVNTLHEGDDFGKLALINDAPRAATIVLRENNCHFLRVDKENFNRILRDVEANTVRLKEHGKDVLILEKITTNSKQVFSSHFKYTVMAGTPQKMLEHLLETRLDGRGMMGGGDNFIIATAQDPFLDDFLLTHIVFLPTHQLVEELDKYYNIDYSNQDKEFILACKRRVIQFVYRWVTTIRHPVFEDDIAVEFLDDLAQTLESDIMQFNSLQEEASLMHHVMSQLRRYQEDRKAHEGQKWKLPPLGQPISLFSTGDDTNRTIIMPQDDIIFRVYCADHTYCTLRLPVDSTAETIKLVAADKLKIREEELLLVEVKSNGERVVFKDNDISIPTALSINGRIFVSPKDHLDALTCLSEQEEATQGIEGDIEMFGTKELAYYMTLFDWDLFWCVHEYELVYHTFGRHHFGQITANLDVFLRRFNEIQFWVVTEVCMMSSLSKRVAVLRKFIKLAAYCREFQNLNAFCAIVMGLSNVAVSRLSNTWDKLPSKFRKLYTEFESMIDPSRNHRAYRVSVGKLQPPVVPFMPLLLKDMTFTHEGNKTSLDGLVNFEKMHMLAQTMRTIRFCRSRHLVLDPPSPKSEGEVKSYISCLRVIDNQRILTSMSQKLEPRRS